MSPNHWLRLSSQFCKCI